MKLSLDFLAPKALGLALIAYMFASLGYIALTNEPWIFAVLGAIAMGFIGILGAWLVFCRATARGLWKIFWRMGGA